jgi:hypothetical protein
MATAREPEEEKQLFETIRRSEESIIQAGRNWAKAVGDAMPVEMPIVSGLVKGAFDFAEEVLKAQREFAHSMLTATRTGPAHKATRPPAHRPTSKVA